MCIQKHPNNYAAELYAQHQEGIKSYLSSKVAPDLKSKRGSSLLQAFVEHGNNHTILNKWYAQFYAYLVSPSALPLLTLCYVTLYPLCQCSAVVL